MTNEILLLGLLLNSFVAAVGMLKSAKQLDHTRRWRKVIHNSFLLFVGICLMSGCLLLLMPPVALCLYTVNVCWVVLLSTFIITRA